MTKKKVVKKSSKAKRVKKEKVDVADAKAEAVDGKGNRDVLIDNLLIEANTVSFKIKQLNQRITRIVAAIDKSKSVRGM